MGVQVVGRKAGDRGPRPDLRHAGRRATGRGQGNLAGEYRTALEALGEGGQQQLRDLATIVHPRLGVTS